MAAMQKLIHTAMDMGKTLRLTMELLLLLTESLTLLLQLILFSMLLRLVPLLLSQQRKP